VVEAGDVTAPALALRHPNRLRALVLSDTSRGSGFDPERTAMMAERAAQYAADPVGFVRDRTPLLVADTTAASVVADIAAIMDRACRMPGYGYAAASLGETDHTADLGRIHVPTLVVVGEHDRVCPPADSRVLADGIDGAVYVEVPDSGHLPNQECPEVFNRIVGDWLEGLPV
jgi:pimeloyl-ACP methyl ester carboxylesterase